MAWNKINSSKLLAVFCLIISAMSVANAEIDISNINVNDIQSQLPAELANTNFTLEDVKNLFRNKCIEVAGKDKGEEAYLGIETAAMNMFNCTTNILNFTAVQAEIDDASPRGELDVVFGKYCQKRPEALKCIEDFSDTLTPCLEQEEKDNQDIVLRIVRSLLNFVCHKGGDQIALFIAEKGPECLRSKSDGIQKCLNNTYSGYVPNEGIENVKSLPKFIMGPKQCDEMDQLEDCVISKLDSCQEITPANIVESMFRFIRNETMCPPKKRNNALVSTTSTILTPLMGVFMTFYYLSKWLRQI